MDKNQAKRNETAKHFIFGILLGVAIISFFVILTAVLMAFGILPVFAANLYASLALAAGCFAAGFFVALKEKARGLIYGLLSGIILIIMFTLVALIATRHLPTISTLFKLIIGIVSGGLGGILGVNAAAKSPYGKV